MAFSSDADLLAMQPGIFNYGVVSFADYHQKAEEELVRDIQLFWIPRQYVLTVDSFDRYQLDEGQWKRAACCRVLGWHVLPRLAVSSDASAFWNAMADEYRQMYRAEIDTVVGVGVWYDSGDGLVRVPSRSLSESSRVWR